ncbi:amidohydrolase family protein [Novosphingobium sp.]|uniref:N-acyl-D-amino-acid deacylase family protein n=1 Tax=Novosphingobium sp. TaxID=1874826 RepID=UPI001DDA2F59|nr:amidohydrolase family protein [Novosphingobium sp.]MBX9662850.1 amidohydrolase family protein [Novosphingobium sp.]
MRTSLAGLAVAASLALTVPAAASTLITDAEVYDGTGAPATKIAVRIEGDHIQAIGTLKPRKGETVIAAKGLVLAPGFIDAHSHHDVGDYKDRSMPLLLAQGVTTIVVGQDGGSHGPFAELAAKYAARPAAINVAAYTGHGWLRDSAMGADYKRVSTPAELAKMQALLAADMKAGSLGLSSGLEYDPGIYSDHAELVDLARTAAAGGGRYISHMRSEDVAFDAALDELLDIGEKAKLPVQISHIKLGIADRWGEAKAVIARLDAARARGIDVTADIYPYEYWHSTLTVNFPKRDFTDLAASRFALAHMTPPEGMLLDYYAPEPAFEGQTIARIAAARQEEPAVTYLWLINRALDWEKAHPDARGGESVIGTAMAPADIADFLAWKHTVVCSDGMIGSRHPRGAGAMAKILRYYVREQHVLTLPEAIHKMTGQTAAQLGLAGHGLIKPGYKADLVLFDPVTITDHAKVGDSAALATGVSRVFVSGALVYADGKPTGTWPGRFLKRGEP